MADKLLHTEKVHRDNLDFIIKVYEQEPNVDKMPSDFNSIEEFDEFYGTMIRGTHRYEVFLKGEIVFEDDLTMWDLDACLDTADQDCYAENL